MITLHPEILSKNGKPQFAVIPYEEFLQIQAALALVNTEAAVNPRFGGFYENLSAEEQAERQGVAPIASLEALAWPGDPGDWEGFDEAVEEWRHKTAK